jgi:allantoin racemase
MPTIVFLSGVRYAPEESARRRAVLQGLVRPGFTIEYVGAPDGPGVLEQPAEFEQARAAGIAAVKQMRPDSCGAVIWGGAYDPYLPDLRAAARLPIIGPGEASLFIARLTGSRLAILTSQTGVAGVEAMLARGYARPETVVARPMKTTVRKILADMNEARRVIRDAAAAAVREDRADVLMLGSMTQGTLGIAAELREEFKVPVLDPLVIAVQAAEQVAGSRGI